MNKKLEKVCILGTGKGLVIPFLESQGGINKWQHKDNNLTSGYYIDTDLIIIQSLHPENCQQCLTLKKAQELIDSKPELTFPRKMIVWDQNNNERERIILLEKDGMFLGIYEKHEDFFRNPMLGSGLSTSWWSNAKELPTQQEINQEKIKNLQDNLDAVSKQKWELECQINNLKLENGE